MFNRLTKENRHFLSWQSTLKAWNPQWCREAESQRSRHTRSRIFFLTMAEFGTSHGTLLKLRENLPLFFGRQVEEALHRLKNGMLADVYAFNEEIRELRRGLSEDSFRTGGLLVEVDQEHALGGAIGWGHYSLC